MSTNPKTTIVTALVLTGVLAIVRDVGAGDVPDVPRLVIGGMVAAIGLTALAGPAPELARALALLVLLGSALTNGPKAVAAVNTRLTTTKRPKAATP